MVSGSWAWTSMTKPKSVGRLPLTSVQLSPASSERIDVPVLLHEEDVGARGVHGDVVDAVADFGVGVGDVVGERPLLMGFQVLPPSSVRKAPAAEMAM